MSYVEPYNLWLRIEHLDDKRAASAGRYDPVALITAENGKRRAPVMRAAENGLFETVKVALDAGLHPNDTTVFKDGGLLAMHHWYSRPEYAALALSRGADPDTGADASIDGSTKTMCVARYLATRLYEDAYEETEMVSCMQAESLAIILRAGSKKADINPLVPEIGLMSPSAAWLLSGMMKVRQAVDDRVALVIPLLKAAGCDIDTACANGHENFFSVPIVAAVRRRRLKLVQAYIAAGARLDDEHIITGAKYGKDPLTIFEEAEKSFGPGGASLIREAIMAKVIAESKVRAPVAPAEQAPRRRVAIV
jgi:hypothetical protein